MSSTNRDLHDILCKVARYLEHQRELYGDFVVRTPRKRSENTPIEDDTHKTMQTELFGESEVRTKNRESVEPTSNQLFPNEPWVEAKDLPQLDSLIHACPKCHLSQTRTNFVFGVGNPDADLVLIGEAPGADEDAQGEPFVGRAGQLLNKILEAIGFRREDVYICNILKCRPPNNRDPQPDEVTHCEPYLWKQLEILNPKLILCLGRISAQVLLRTNDSLTNLRGKVHDYRGIKLMVTYHPAALLRNPQWKKPTWEDVQQVRRLYDELRTNR